MNCNINKNFYDWFTDQDRKQGALISKITASYITGKSISGISSMIRRNKINIFKYKDYKTEYLSLNEILDYDNNKYIRK